MFQFETEFGIKRWSGVGFLWVALFFVTAARLEAGSCTPVSAQISVSPDDFSFPINDVVRPFINLNYSLKSLNTGDIWVSPGIYQSCGLDIGLLW